DALHGQPRPEIVLVSDGALGPLPEKTQPEPGKGGPPQDVAAAEPEPASEPPALRAPLLDEAVAGGVRVSYLPVGKTGNNVAITQFAVRRYPLDKSRHEVLLEVTNTNDEPAEIELSL